MWENCHDYDPDVEKALAEMREAAAVCRAQREARAKEEQPWRAEMDEAKELHQAGEAELRGSSDPAVKRSLELYDQAKANIDADPRMAEWRAQVDAQLESPENRRLERTRDEIPMYKALAEAAKYAGRELTHEEIREKDARFAREAGEAIREMRELAQEDDADGKGWMKRRVPRSKGCAAFLRALYNSGQWTNRNPDEIQLEALVADTVQDFLYWDRLDDEDFTWEQMKSVITNQGVSLMSLMQKFLWAFQRTGLFEGQEGTFVSYKQPD